MSMSVGFIEFLAILTSLGEFGIGDNPAAPTAAEVARYAVPNADLAVHVDLAATVPGNYRALRALPRSKKIRDTPGARAALEQIVQKLEETREQVKTTIGLDPVTDVTSATLWVVVPGSGEPEVLVVARGKFSRALPGKIAQAMGGAVGDIDGNPTVTSPGGDATIAVVGSSMLAGTSSLVKARAARAWRAGRPRAGSSAARLGSMLDRKPFLVIASSPSREAASRLAQELGPPDSTIADAATSHEFAAIALARDGVSWTWTDRTRKGYARAVLASEGALELMRAAHLASRGLAKLALAAIESHARDNAEIAAIVRQRDDILRLVTSVTGDGSFKAKVTRRASARTVAVDARGSKLSDVVPIAGVLPLAGAAMWLTMSGDEPPVAAASAARVEASAPAEAARGGLLIRDTYRTVKERQQRKEREEQRERQE